MKPQRKTLQEIQDDWNDTPIKKIILEASRKYEEAIKKKDYLKAKEMTDYIDKLLLQIN